jgi:hypothetical protein
MQDGDFAPPASFHRKEPHVVSDVPILMEKVEDYRSRAEECRAMARRARSPQERDMLLNMARTWDDLSVHRAQQIARQKRIVALLAGGDRMTAASIPVDRLNASNDQ